VHWAPGIPRALYFQGRNISGIARAQRAARTSMFVDVIPGRECNERNLEISMLPHRLGMTASKGLRARNDA
jgi:hypothetical protein